MRIVLLDIMGYGPTFIAEDRVRLPVGHEGPPKPGFRAWIERKRHKIAADLEQTTGVLQKILSTMQRLVAPDEQLLRNLRKAETLIIEHPPQWDRASVESAWRVYLGRKVRKHVVWMIVNAVLTPPAIIILTLLPGPNVVGYWVLYRAIVHGLAVLGARKARKGVPPASFCENARLDGAVSPDDHPRIAALEEGLNLPGLRLLIARYVPMPTPE